MDSESAKLLYMHAVKKGENYSLIVLDLFISGPETGLDLVHFLDVLGDRSLTLLVSNVDEGELKIQTADLKLWLEVIGKPLNVPRLDRILDTAEVMQR